MNASLNRFIEVVRKERQHQIDKWGQQRHHKLTNYAPKIYTSKATFFKSVNDERARRNQPAVWADILLEEVYEAFEALSQGNLEDGAKELAEVATVCAAICEQLEGEVAFAPRCGKFFGAGFGQTGTNGIQKCSKPEGHLVEDGHGVD